MTNLKQLLVKDLMTLLLGFFGWGALLASSYASWGYFLMNLLGICSVMKVRKLLYLPPMVEETFHPLWLEYATSLGINEEILSELGTYLYDSPLSPSQKVELVKRWVAMDKAGRKMLKDELLELHLNHICATKAFANLNNSKKKPWAVMR